MREPAPLCRMEMTLIFVQIKLEIIRTIQVNFFFTDRLRFMVLELQDLWGAFSLNRTSEFKVMDACQTSV